MSQSWQIGQVARQVDLSPKTIRYYESIGLLPEPQRGPNGYRQYTAEEIERIDFIRRARTLGFGLDEIREILALRDRNEAPCPYVLSLIASKIQQVERQIADLRRLQKELETLRRQAEAIPLEVLANKSCLCHIIENLALEEAQ